MKLNEAKSIIENSQGYIVSFEHCGDGLLRSDSVPDMRNNEDPFPTEVEAIQFGSSLAYAMKGKACNFCIRRADNHNRVGEWTDENK